MKRIAYYGGSFNPVHMGHIRTAQQAVKELELDMLYFMPNAVPPHKSALYLDYQIRVQLLELALADVRADVRAAASAAPSSQYGTAISSPAIDDSDADSTADSAVGGAAAGNKADEDAGTASRMDISLVEHDPTMKHFTHGTLTRLKDLHHDADLIFILGMDSLLKLDTWKNWDRLIDLASIAVLTRPGYSLNDLPPAVREHINTVNARHAQHRLPDSQPDSHAPVPGHGTATCAATCTGTATASANGMGMGMGMDHGQSAHSCDGAAGNSFIFMNNADFDISSTELRALLNTPELDLSPEQQEQLSRYLSPSELNAIRKLGLFAPAAP